MPAFETIVPTDLPTTEIAVREALAAEGFGIVSEIDVASRINGALGLDRPPLKILGACNPRLAHDALTLDPSVALLLPCNVALDAVEHGTRVRVVDPRELIDDPAFKPLADDAAERLQAAVGQLADVPA